MLLKLGTLLSLVCLCFLEVSGFVFEVKQVTGNAHDCIGNPILVGQRTDTFSMKQRLGPAWLKGPCVTVTVPSNGVRLMATRGGMIMVFRDGMAIYGTHRNHFSKSRPSSGFSSPVRSPRSMTPTRSGSITPPVFFTKDGAVVERRKPKIPPKSMNCGHESPHMNIPKTRITRTAMDLSPQSSFEISSSPKNFRHMSPTQASLEIGPYSSSSQGPSSTDSSSAPRLLRTSESKGTLELIVDQQVNSSVSERFGSIKEPLKVRSRSQSYNIATPERSQSCKRPPRKEELISSSNGVVKAVSSPLSASEKKRRSSSNTKTPDLELSRTESRSGKRSSATKSTKSLSSSSTKRSSPRTDSESNTSPRSLGESPRTNLLGPSSAESSPRSIFSVNSSGSNSRQSSPRTLAASNISKNVDTNVQLELEDVILVVIPNHDADVNVVLDIFLSPSDKFDEIDLKKMSSIGELVLLKVTEQSRRGGLIKRRSKSYSAPVAHHFEPDLASITQ